MTITARLIDAQGRVSDADIELDAEGKPPPEVRVPHYKVTSVVPFKGKQIAELVFILESQNPAFVLYRYARREELA